MCLSVFFPRGGSCGFSLVEKEESKKITMTDNKECEKIRFIIFVFNLFLFCNKYTLTSINQSVKAWLKPVKEKLKSKY
jgi:hypothetical protein